MQSSESTGVVAESTSPWRESIEIAGWNEDNPFFVPSELPFQAPDFTKISIEHFLPAFEAGMAEHLKQIEAIADQESSPTFENTLTAMELSGSTLTRVQRVFFNLTAAHTNPEIQKIQAEIAPRLAQHADNISLNPKLFARIQSLNARRDDAEFDAEQRRLIKETYERFVRAGAMLTPEQKARIREINQELSSLGTKFEENLLQITRERSVVVDNRDELRGLSDAQIAAAAELAKQRGHEGKFVLSITNTTRQPVLVSLENRDLRRRVWEASAYRGLGRDGGIDNRPLVLQLARLRAEKASILGYSNHAAYALEPQMAKQPEAALAMLINMVPDVVEKVHREADDIRAMLRADGIEDDVQAWDWEYYAEKVRSDKYAIDQSVVKPYFELNSVLHNGVFYTMNRLFGIQFVERDDIPVYHPDVRVFDVLEADGTPIGLFYADYFARDSKRGGAWMNSFVVQSHLLDQRPVIVNVLNVPPPAAGQPALLTFDEAVTMFHEMGHAVHGLFSDVRYQSLAGTAVPRDFVEFPSTFQEDWAIDPTVLRNYARHYETGEVLPQELLERLLEAKTFNQGFDTLEYLSAALLDLAWHSLAVDEIPDDVEEFEAQSLHHFGVDLPMVPPRYRTAFFAHVWPGGYSASYYAYMWSEVLAADGFQHVQQNGGLSSVNGDAFRRAVLSRGGSAEPMELYVEFAGRPPQVDALLIRRGLKSRNE
ncbi:MAG TPA: M3 family metallopeptidase [Pirellulaceae bacterium]|nr:M3 family metallopeptidase [Pirellulaceae bacterium]